MIFDFTKIFVISMLFSGCVRSVQPTDVLVTKDSEKFIEQSIADSIKSFDLRSFFLFSNPILVIESAEIGEIADSIVSTGNIKTAEFCVKVVAQAPADPNSWMRPGIAAYFKAFVRNGVRPNQYLVRLETHRRSAFGCFIKNEKPLPHLIGHRYG